MVDECSTCLEEVGKINECPGSRRACGHHCNHIWDQDACCWCPAHVNDNGDLVGADGEIANDWQDVPTVREE